MVDIQEPALATPAFDSTLHFALIAAIILISGFLGGWLRHAMTPASQTPRISWWTSVGLGMLAAGLVPLFLEVTASRIIDDAATTPRHYLVFVSLCLLFAYSAERVVDRITSQVLQDIKNRTAAAEETASDAQAAAMAAQSEAQVATAVATPPSTTATGDDPRARLESLTAQYDEIRTTERGRPSTDRTRRMTQIVVDMTRTIRNNTLLDLDPIAYLSSPREEHGRRLLGFAYCFEKPDAAHLDSLIKAIEIEDKPFGQYWGLRALDQLAGNLRDYDRDRVLQFAETMQSRAALRGTDRHHVLSSIVSQLKDSAAT